MNSLPQRLILSLLLVALAAAEARAQEPLSATALRRHLEVLAADRLEGRETGSVGGLAAAHYLAGVLAAAGWQPAGDDGSWFQDIGQDGHARTGPALLTLSGPDDARRQAAHGTDWRLLRGWAPDLDLTVLPVTSRDQLPDEPDPAVAVVLGGPVPVAFSWLGEGRGAGWGAVVLTGSDSPGEASEPPRHLVGEPGERVLLMTRGDLSSQLLDGSLTRLRMTVPVGPPRPAFNVLAVLPGVGTPEDPGLADEVVLLSAHYDHIGVVDVPPGEDGIYNGADDDASGVATVLELARAFGAGEPPARTLVALLVSGEEHGLLGTYHWLEQPSHPLEQLVCNVNFEMLGRPDKAVGGAGRLWLTGHAYSTLGPEWSARGLAIVADPHLEKNFFRRSDNWPLVEAGIVAQTLSSYGLHGDYHAPSDEADTLDYEHMAAVVSASWQAVAALADGSLRPAWLPGAPVPGAPPAEDGDGDDAGDDG